MPRQIPMKESNATDRTFHGLLSRMIKRTEPEMMAATEINDRGGRCVSKGRDNAGDDDDDGNAPFKPRLAFVSFADVWMIVHCSPCLKDSFERRKTAYGHNSRLGPLYRQTGRALSAYQAA